MIGGEDFRYRSLEMFLVTNTGGLRGVTCYLQSVRYRQALKVMITKFKTL